MRDHQRNVSGFEKIRERMRESEKGRENLTKFGEARSESETLRGNMKNV